MAAADNEIPDPEDRALAVFRRHGGVLRTSDALASGVHPRTLYELRDAGLIEQLSRGCTGWPICRRWALLTWQQ